MKKYFFLLISTFISSLILANSTFATTFVDGTEYWSVEELLVLNANYADEVRLHCPRLNFEEEYEYYACIDNYYWDTHINQETGEWIEETPEEMALSQFRSGNTFYLTSINPSTGVVRAVFQDLPWSFGGAVFDRKWSLDRFYFFWSEADDNYYKVYQTPEEFKNGTASSADHIMFFGDSSENGEDWFIANRELEFPSNGPIDLAKVQGYYFYADAVNQGEIGPSNSAMFDLDQCTSSPKYVDGMECRLMFAPTEGQVYLPFGPENKEYYEVPYKSLYIQSESSADPESTTDPEQPISDTEPISTPDDSSLEQSSISTTSNTVTPSAPNTGVNRELVCEKTIEFPWWITLLVALGEVLIIWWFTPAYKNYKNRQKKS